MKKLVVLMLVVGMASLASAGLSFAGSFEVDVDGTTASTFTLEGLAGDTAEGWIWVDYILYTGQLGAGSIHGDVTVNGNTALDNTTYTNGSYLDGIGVVIPDEVGGADALASDGTMVTFTMVALGTATIGDTYELMFLNGSFQEQTGMTVLVTVVPEPMTMVLLGLGGLFLRRKK